MEYMYITADRTLKYIACVCNYRVMYAKSQRNAVFDRSSITQIASLTNSNYCLP